MKKYRIRFQCAGIRKRYPFTSYAAAVEFCRVNLLPKTRIEKI